VNPLTQKIKQARWPDRGFYSWGLWNAAAATGASLLWRMPGVLSLSNFLCKSGQLLSFCYITVNGFLRLGQTGTRSGNVTANAFIAAFHP
jgi:hypothetical protein